MEKQGNEGNQLNPINNHNITSANNSSTFSNHLTKDDGSENISCGPDSIQEDVNELLFSSLLHQDDAEKESSQTSLKSIIQGDLKFVFDLFNQEDSNHSDLEFDYKMKLKIRYEFLNKSVLENKIIMKEDYTKFVKGRLITILKKKKGCVLMHKALLNCSKETLDLIYKEVWTQLESLIIDNYVTYFIELLFIVLKEEYTRSMLTKILAVLQDNLDNKAMIGFVSSIISQDLSTGLSQQFLDFVFVNINNILNSPISTQLLITTLIRFDSIQLDHILPFLVKRLPSLINIPHGWSLSVSLLETHKDAKTQYIIAKELADNFAKVANSECGYQFLSKMIREFKSNQAWKFNSHNVKQKIKDNLWIIMNNRWVTSRLKWKKLEDSQHYKNIDLAKTGLFKEVISYVCTNEPDYYFHIIKLLIEGYQSAFVIELIHKLKYKTNTLIELLRFDSKLSIFYLILKVCKLEVVVEVYNVLRSVSLTLNSHSEKCYSELLSKYSLRITEHLMLQEQKVHLQMQNRNGQNTYKSCLQVKPSQFSTQTIIPNTLVVTSQIPYYNPALGNIVYLATQSSTPNSSVMLLPNQYRQFSYVNHN